MISSRYTCSRNILRSGSRVAYENVNFITLRRVAVWSRVWYSVAFRGTFSTPPLIIRNFALQISTLGAKHRAIVDDPSVRWDHPNARNQSHCHSISLHEVILFQISSSVSWVWSTLTARLRICTCKYSCSIIGPAIDACSSHILVLVHIDFHIKEIIGNSLENQTPKTRCTDVSHHR